MRTDLCDHSFVSFVCWETDHTLIVGKGANKFAKEVGAVTLPTDQLVTEAARKEWEHLLKFRTSVATLFSTRCETAIIPNHPFEYYNILRKFFIHVLLIITSTMNVKNVPSEITVYC